MTEHYIEPRPKSYVIETTVTIDGQSIHRRYEAPSQDEVVKLAERCGEVLEPVTQPVEIKT